MVASDTEVEQLVDKLLVLFGSVSPLKQPREANHNMANQTTINTIKKLQQSEANNTPNLLTW